MDLVSEGLLVAERALEGRQRRAQIQQSRELRNLVGDRFGLHVRKATEAQIDVELVTLFLAQLVSHREVEAELLLAHHLREVVLIDVDGLAILQRAGIGSLREVAHDQHLERQLNLFLRIARGRFVDDVDALLGRN